MIYFGLDYLGRALLDPRFFFYIPHYSFVRNLTVVSRRARRRIIKEHLESNPVEMVRLLNEYEWVVDYKEVRKHLHQTTRQRLRRNI